VILESLVLFSCLNNTGCQEASSNYYATHPSLKEIVDENETKAKNIAGSFLVEYAFPIIGTAAKKEVYFKVNREFSIKFNELENRIVYTKEW
jgi:hypothetical protein